MAHAEMGFTRKEVAGGVEILYNSEYVGDAITLDESAFDNGVCLAGTPLTVSGETAAGADAYGILLHDVYLERPQGTVVIGGYINTRVAEKHSGVTISEGVKDALKNVVFIDKEA